MWQH